ncbi:NADH-quinone oxidoreductase subunit C [Streptantibioticus ferralitis]|uniref:NADH-quinone oxidoreductase subunit C n=1 Tax=Streptantibioticus ferralitis TaxID=236510 RepID=A0ABT5Z6I3_9ACTN|nr:NADH-quinone oxidoreductase subunit C [Streptantibioticus ferralitis]MDF2259437.1 NADH-quinone oxidoreductase subunit C [Streptantibioticus ferralitis]
MTEFDRLPEAAAEIFGAEATAEQAYDLLTVDVPAAAWISALETARDRLGCGYFDWLSAVDEPGIGFRVCAHVADPGPGSVRHLVLRTTVPHDAPELPTATGVYAGAAWHERETHEMFGVDFTGHPHLVPLLLPEGFEGHPLRKDFVLAARVAKSWPGAKEPGESDHGGPKRRQMLPPGVPDPNEWGPLKGQLPPAPARAARTPRAAGAGAAAGERPVRRARSVTEGSASQQAEAAATPAPRRTRSVSQGSASQRAAAEARPEATEPGAERPAPRRRTSDAPWNQPRQTAPAGEDEAAKPDAAEPEAAQQPSEAEAEAAQAKPDAAQARPEPDAAQPEPGAAENPDTADDKGTEGGEAQ